MMRGEDGDFVLAPPPSTASYDAGLYAADLYAAVQNERQWRVARDIFQAFVADERMRPDVLTYSAMVNMVLDKRLDEREVAIVRRPLHINTT